MKPSSTHDNSQAGKSGWTRIHLVYFVLAAFDLVAVMGGLWLSDYTKSEFEKSIHSLQLGDLLRDNTSAVLTAAIDLNGPANEIFSTGDVAKTQRDADAASKAFDETITKDHYDPETKELLDEAVATAGGSTTAYRRGGLAIWYPSVYAKFESVEGQIKQLKNLQVAETQATIDNFAKGDRQEAGLHMERSDEASRQIMRKTRDLLDASAAVSDNTIAESKKSFDFATLLQYLIGGGILLMVMMVMAYAHYVGKLLRGKYNELETANVAATTFSAELGAMNDDITKLNVELAANMKMLTEAQNESVRKGRMAQLGQLTATVAHELRNPLGAVRTSVFLLERKVKGKGLGIEAQIDRINNGVTRCDTIISQLLDFARTKPIQPEALAFDEWLAKLIGEEAQEMPAAVAIECDLGLGNALVPFDPARMRRVLINLISNASEAVVGKGENAMKPGIKAPLIVISTRNTSRGIELSVVDNGPGIAAENIEKIFEPLFTTKNFGTGLGLPAVQKIMEQHGGGLDVRSSPGQGAEFTAWWPVQTQGVVAA